MKFNDNQLKAINTDENCVVSAGAGSGKTEVLTSRFIRLLEEGKAHCDQILTITFTRKATAEMRARIHDKLIQNKMAEELKRFPFCSISTVDSFFTSIVRTDCQQYGFASDFTMLNEDDFELTSLRTARDFLEENFNNEAVKKLVEKIGADATAKMFTALAENFFNIVKPIDAEANAEFVLATAEEKLRVAIREIIDTASSMIILMKDDSGLDSNRELLEDIVFGLEKNQIGILSSISLYNGRKGKTELRQLLKPMKEKLVSLANDCLTFEDAILNRDYLYSLYKLIAQYEKRINTVKRQEGALSFADVMHIAIDILITNKTIRHSFKEKYKYIMIDEFQDNNDEYRKLLYLLSERLNSESDGVPDYSELEKNKIFLVGDEKQSIYRFRGADVSVFKRLCSEIGNLMELDVNYRSQKELVDAFNVIFSSVMENNGQAFEADFKKLDSKPKDAIEGKLIFHNFLQDSSDKDSAEDNEEEMATAVQSEAKGISELINEMLTTDNYLIIKDEKAVRPKESDIAILLRSSGNQNHYEKALKIRKIKYTIAEAKGLTNEAVFNDFYTLLQLCLYPYDKLAFVSFLKSPFCSLNDKEIADILNKTESTEFAGFLSIIDDVRKQLAAVSLPEVLDYIYYNLGYRNFLITNPANQVYSEHYDYLYALACDFQKSGKGVSEFLDYIRPLLGQASKIKSLDVFREETDGVNIMTIHKSKGLGFPIVIVAGMESSGKGRPDAFKIIKHNERIFVNCAETSDGKFVNFLADSFKDSEAEKEYAELKRLFYVAATRAKFHVVFSATVKESLLKDDSKKKTMLKMLVDSTSFNFFSQQAETVKMKGIPFSLIPEKETFSTISANEKSFLNNAAWYNNVQDFNPCWQRKTVAVTELSSSPDKTVSEGTTEILEAIDCDAVVAEKNLHLEFGTLTHSYLENFIKKTDYEPDFKCESLSENDVLKVRKCAKQLAHSFTSSPLFEKLKAFTLYSEREFYMKRDDLLLNGVIDLLAVSEKEAIVIDFKTDKIKNPQEYELQVKTYVEAVEKIYPDKKVSACIVYLRDALNPVEVV